MNLLECLRIIRKALWVFFQALGFGCCAWAVASLFLSFTVGATPVHIASALNWPKAIDLLAAAGASVDTPANYFVMPPLHIAVGHGHADATRALLRAGASIEATTASGATALHLAALKDQHVWRCWRQQVHRSRQHCCQAGQSSEFRVYFSQGTGRQMKGRQRCTWPHAKVTG